MAKTISYTIIYDFNIAINISYLNIMTSKSYKTISEANLIGYVDTPETSYSDVKTSELYNTIGDTDISVYVSIVMEELFETICETECIEYMATLKASNVHIKMDDPDIAIRETTETSYDMVVDIVFSRTVERAMWWSAGHHIERECENIPSLLGDIQDDNRHLGSRLHPQKKEEQPQQLVPQPSMTTIIIVTMTIIDNNHGDKGDKKEDLTSTQRLPSEHLRTKNSEFAPKFHKNPQGSSLFVLHGW